MGLSLPSGRIVNFTWLDFIPGRITETPLTQDVLTGPMSGCWLTLYRRAGQRYVGHVGTDSNSPLATTNAKTKWNAFALKSYGDVMGGFRPSTDIGAISPPIPLREEMTEHFLFSA